MKKIGEAEAAAQNSGPSNRAGHDVDTRLPCHYFDFIVGTSTGGYVSLIKSHNHDSQYARLIAIMLGRLRMTVDECIYEYMRLGSYVFADRRWWRLTKYDHRRLKASIRKVIAIHCKDLHDETEPCVGDDYLRQWDFSQYKGPFENFTCKV